MKKGIKRSFDELYQPEKRRVLPHTSFDEENVGSIHGARRLSARLRGKVKCIMVMLAKIILMF